MSHCRCGEPAVYGSLCAMHFELAAKPGRVYRFRIPVETSGFLLDLESHAVNWVAALEVVQAYRDAGDEDAMVIDA